MSQAEAVRQAIAVGMDAPSDGVEFIMAHFGIEMDNKKFSLAKSQQKIRDAKWCIRQVV
ncbi:hypothetical protein [Singulisphaera acidiphila]|uniref:Uncharacterized protein n=1 Tax=Singulisphaera acidiphila (strain ATCC BAA-1392 / DSM 18658 / VKM B-2454 / MOB10) TaxID=886293 RepID=L0DC19_SINAD|nr:hypothetical protein [Singulisphaera acidiphila]AGA26395.1 hypothetical protein Sinac_2057 [Singulisphaera acidiphila DSM 18658]